MKLNRPFLFVAICTLLACKKEDDSTPNPFLDPSLQAPPNKVDTTNLDPGSFAYLHAKIFKPTCANSGCHDGNFEPDFRTISSSYNTLVYHPVIQNNDAGSYSFRVIPGDAENSFLHVRLTSSLPINASGMMPLSLEPGSDWNDNKTEYIQNIVDWINEGAKDPFGNLPSKGNAEPQVVGLMAFEVGNSNNPLPKVNAGNAPIVIPKLKSIDLWVAVRDDKTLPEQLTVNELKSSYSLSNFENATTNTLVQQTAISGIGFGGQNVDFTHKVTLDFSSDTVGTLIYLRTYFKDADHSEATETPNAGSNNAIKSLFVLKVDSM